MSLTVEILSGSLIPEEFVKFVENIPISELSFIISAKFSSDPAIPSAKATQASLPMLYYTF